MLMTRRERKPKRLPESWLKNNLFLKRKERRLQIKSQLKLSNFKEMTSTKLESLNKLSSSTRRLSTWFQPS
jgi:hypothetical protein